MTIQRWFALSAITQQKAADALGISDNYLCELLSRKKAPSKELAAQISAATGGAVTVAELLYPDGVPAGAVMVSQDAPVDSTCAACHAGDTTIPDAQDADEDVSHVPADGTVPVTETKAADCAA